MPIKVQGVNSFRIIMLQRNNKQAVQKNLSLALHSFPRLSCHLLCQELLSLAMGKIYVKKQKEEGRNEEK